MRKGGYAVWKTYCNCGSTADLIIGPIFAPAQLDTAP
jgi:hypothetical protein